MKVALLSFHNAANYGASMQAYALEKYLLDNDERDNSLKGEQDILKAK